MARKREERSPGKSASQQQGGSGACGGCAGTNSSGVSSTGSSSSGSKAALTNSSPSPIYASLKQQLATMGLAMREIPGDGNCLFGALADQMDGSRDTHYQHRKEIVAYMRENRLHFEPFVEDDVSFHDHLRRLSDLGTFGGNECIVAFARLHGVIVVIHQLNTALWTIRGSEESDGAVLSNVPEVHISYHNGDHYNSVRAAGDCNKAPANIRMAVLVSGRMWPNAGSKQCAGVPQHQLEEKLMQCTGCDNPHVARHFLQQHNNCLSEAIEALILYIHKTEVDDNDSDSDNNTTNSHVRSPSAPSLWSEGGTGLRVLGNEAATLATAAAAAGEAGGGKHRGKHLSTAKRRDLKKQLRKHQSNDRKKQQAAAAGYYDQDTDDGCSDSTTNVIIVKDLACLSI